MVRLLKIIMMAVVLSACSGTFEQLSSPTASRLDIERARENLAHIDQLTVTDEGYITYYQTLPHGYKWRTSVIKQNSYTWSCETMYYLLLKGFVIKMGYKGKGGREEHFDLAKCNALSS
ncbi:hypothetical protein [Vibrio hangzhouensis]|uniref:hypothetical protein n=1 Tax=Vibrio hangzhouensis TaxID=462991 RepID=UPI001C9713EA|nr:hypothetical protein [Vibrio hangzhouensis]MBY6199382.1 hypothetical protein [Vibrio hangzhouensis]